MSVFADFTPLSEAYDDSRLPVGAHLYLGLVYSSTGKTAEQLHLLDAGCGTGNHVKYLLEHGLARATMLDANDGMLTKAREKLTAYTDQNRVEFVHDKLPSLPFNDESFDVVMSNAVLHHLTDINDTNFTTIQTMINESFRVLKHNGVMIIELMSPYQSYNGYWYTKLVPNALKNMVTRTPDPAQFKQMFKQAGFQSSNVIVELDQIIFPPEWYFKADGPLNDDWWMTNTLMATAEPEEREKAVKLIQDLKDNGELDNYFKEADKLRPHIGQYCINYAKKA